MKKIQLGILLGVMAGIIDVIPMLIQKLTWDANLSALSLWIISGFLIATTNLKLKGAVKGILITFLVLLPALILIAWKEPVSLLPIILMTFILGPTLGYLIENFGK